MHQNSLRSKGLMLVLSSPSGAGKSSLAKKLIAAEDNIELSVSVTSRELRAGEINGKDYYFVSAEKFSEMIENNEFLEYAEVFGNKYGTLNSKVNDALSQVKDIVFDVDWQGANSLKKLRPEDIVSVYILPPSLKELRHRLEKRARDSEQVIENRMNKAASELTHFNEYDYVILNDDFDEAFKKLQNILHAERLKLSRQVKLAELVNNLYKEQ